MKKYSFTIAGKKYEVEIASVNGGNAEVSVNGKSYTVALDNAPACQPESAQACQPEEPQASSCHSEEPKAPSCHSEEPKASPCHSEEPKAPKESPSPSGIETAVPSPMQGTVVEVKVAEGQAVKSGDTLIVIESMKMEVEIASTADGVVKAVKVSKGDQLEEGQTVVIVA